MPPAGCAFQAVVWDQLECGMYGHISATCWLAAFPQGHSRTFSSAGFGSSSPDSSGMIVSTDSASHCQSIGQNCSYFQWGSSLKFWQLEWSSHGAAPLQMGVMFASSRFQERQGRMRWFSQQSRGRREAMSEGTSCPQCWKKTAGLRLGSCRNRRVLQS